MKTHPKDLIQYHFPAMEAFYTFLKDDNLNDLISRLRRIENHYRRINEQDIDDKGIWFRFSELDTQATTINDIIGAFKGGTQANKDYMRNCMEWCCRSAEIEVYYS